MEWFEEVVVYPLFFHLEIRHDSTSYCASSNTITRGIQSLEILIFFF